MQSAKTMDRVDWALLLVLSLLWGGAYFFVGVAVRELPPLTIVFLRVSIAACVMLPVVWWMGQSPPRRVDAWLPFLGMGLLNNVLHRAQVGVVCCCHVDDYANNVIKKHEKTRPDKEDDR
ncbi:MAG: DUF1015 family protein, partial [Pseudomonadota bacterium]